MTTDLSQRVSLTRAEAAEVVGVSEATLRRAIDRGDLVARFSGRKTLIRPADLEAWVESLPTEGPRR